MYELFFALHPTLPRSPVLTTGRLSTTTTTIASDEDGEEDHISALPDQLLYDIVSRLPITDAVRTTALNHSLARIWHSVPLLLDDSHLLHEGHSSIAAKVSSILSSHPGPFETVHLTCNSMGSQDHVLRRWFRAFADKHLQELVFVNCHYPNNVTVPADLFRCDSLKRLYLGVVELPGRSLAGGHAVFFPELREVCLSHCIMRDWDIEHLLACSPKMEKLALVLSMYQMPTRLYVQSRSLRSMVYWLHSLEEIAVVSTPCLERLILWKEHSFTDLEDRTKIKIYSAPNLRVVGYLNPGEHIMQIGQTVVKKGMNGSHSVVPSVKTLALAVRFGFRKEVKMVPCFLKCFPCVKILHVKSVGVDPHSILHAQDNLEFWQKVDYIECLQSSIKKVVFDEFTGQDHEIEFLRFIVERAKKLEEMHIVPAEKDVNAAAFLENFLNHSLSSAVWASPNSGVVQIWAHLTNAWSFDIASDLALPDPFGYMISVMAPASQPS